MSAIELESFMGRTPQDILSHYLPSLDSDSIWEASILKEEYLYTLLPASDSIRIFPGVIPMLQKLGEMGIPRVVISSTHRSLVNRLLSNTNLVELLDEMVPGDEVERGQLLGYADSTGNSTGSHLQLTLKKLSWDTVPQTPEQLESNWPSYIIDPTPFFKELV